MKTLVSRLRVACHQWSGKYSTRLRESSHWRSGMFFVVGFDAPEPLGNFASCG
uniref:Uncharacterized protein n=1 Tax=Anguilla anguilla TaxID=7936 RepID=A0A0E9VKN8_ANGAN